MAAPISERTRRAQRALKGAIGFCFVFMGVEVYFGIRAHSLAVLTDAMHLFTDVAALCLALAATYIATWAGSKRLSFGWHRAEVIGAMGSVFLVWALAAVIVYEGVMRLVAMIKCAKGTEGPSVHCEGVEARVMFFIGCAGFAVNIIVASILMLGGHAHSHGGLAGGANACTGHGHSHGSPPPASPHPESSPSRPLRTAADAAASESPGTVAESDTSNDSSDNGPLLRPSTARPDGVRQRDIPTALTVNDSDEHDHDHDHAHGGHGHSHGHSHGGANEGNMNVRGAMIHAIGDCVQSLGVIGSAGIIWGFNGPEADARSWFNIADPICSLVFAAVTLYTTRYLTVDVFFVLMEATPDGVSHDELLDTLAAVANVEQIEHLHVWALTPTLKNLTAHVIATDPATHAQVLRDCKAIVRAAGIGHSTIQVSEEPEVLSSNGSFGTAGRELSPLCVAGSKRRFRRDHDQPPAV